MPNTTVFVYGTLKAGEANHGLLRDSRLLCMARCPSLRLYDYSSAFPAAGLASDKSHGPDAHGELYEVNDETLARLYRLEGVHELGGGLYEVGRFDCVTDAGESIEATAFYMRPRRLEGRPLTAEGEWRPAAV